MIVSVPMHFRRTLVRGALLALFTILPAATQHVSAQEPMVLTVPENFRREPNGLQLARLEAGAAVRILASQGNWTQVELEGWVWLASLQDSDSADPAIDLVVTSDGGENLRDGPSGNVLGVLAEGTLLEELGRDAAWARVSRVGWIWAESLAQPSGSTNTPEPAPGGSQVTATPAAQAPGGFRTLADGGPILTAPDGDTLAVAQPSSDIEIVRREGGWARVRLEGWMWIPVAADAPASVTAADPAALEPGDLMADPDLHAGRVVSWSIQFISLERAEAVRTDFFEGEPFLLARFGGSDGPFVYIAVPPDRLSEVEGLVPLERITITARVRTGASQLTGAPIVDLIEVDRLERRP